MNLEVATKNLVPLSISNFLIIATINKLESLYLANFFRVDKLELTEVEPKQWVNL